MQTNYKPQFRLFYHLVFGFWFLFVIWCLIFGASAVHAQAVDPSVWQNQSVGLKTSAQNNYRTAGLGFVVEQPDQTSWPLLKLPGGVKLGYFKASAVIGGDLLGSMGQDISWPMTIDLGQAKIPNGSVSSESETSDWSKNTLTYNASQMMLTVSRMTPALLLQSNNNALRLFSGTVNKYYSGGAILTTPVTGTTFPKYIAYSSGGTVQVKQLSSSSLSLPALDNSWIMVWYGTNSAFADTKKPLYYSQGWFPYFDSSSPASFAYQADAPIFISFQHNPTSVATSVEGGIDLNFSGPAGNVSVLPIMGRDHPKASDTESWGTSKTLPTAIQTSIQFWAPRSCQFPSGVAESYAYDGSVDKATITDAFTFTPVCSPSLSFAPVSPVLTIAKSNLNIVFSGPLVDANLPTQFGPTMGINNVNTYSWSIAGLKKYTDNKRVSTNTGSAPSDLATMLAAYIDQTTTNGHFAPWMFTDAEPNQDWIGDIYFNNPADALYQLSEIIPALSEPQKTNAINYLKSERANFPPESTYDLSLTQGKTRDYFSLPATTSPINGGSSVTDIWSRIRPEAFLKRVPLYNFYALARYYDITGEAVPASVITAAKTALNNDMAEQDFATFSWFKGYEQKRVAVQNTNRHVDGLIGAIRLFQKTGDTASEDIARALLAKAAAQRVYMSVFPRWQYSSGLLDLSSLAPDWMGTQVLSSNYGFIYNYDWTTPNDDPTQVVVLDQFETMLHDNSGTRSWVQDMTPGHLVAYLDMVPELARLLSDTAKSDTVINLSKMETFLPNWYVSFGEATLGSEHGLAHPTDSYQMFMAESLIKGTAGDSLAKYLDVPFLYDGSDFFYAQKLAETIKSYQGIAWSDQVGNPTPTPTPSVIPTATNTPSPALTPTTTPSGDTQVPTITITSPANNATVTGTVVLSATITDDTSVASTVYYIDHVWQGSLSLQSGSTYTGSFDATTLSAGSHLLEIQAYDPTNNKGQASITFTVSSVVPTNTPAPTNTPIPTATLAPTATPLPNSTKVALTLQLTGVGTNQTVISPQQPVTVEVIDNTNTTIATKSGTVTYIPASGIFTGTVDLASTPTGNYLLKVKAPRYLRKQIPGIIQLTLNQTSTIPQLPLLVGDANNDNAVDILDWQALTKCFNNLTDPQCLFPQTSDLNDDGAVDGIDINVFLRTLAGRNGQ